MKTFLSQLDKLEISDTSLSSLGPIYGRKSGWDSSSFSLSSQSNINDNCKQLWLIRHGERMDEVATEESRKWRFETTDQRLFDPPLTTNGFKQANERGQILLKELSQIKRNQDLPICIYASPMERTLGTAFEIAKAIKLPIIVVPGLCACALAVRRGGLIKKQIKKLSKILEQKDKDIETKNDEIEDDCELFLNDYGWIGKCNFLSKKEILQQFGKNGVEIGFDFRYLDKFKECVDRLIIESKSNTILCVTHREGIRALDERLKKARAKIPYCALA
eukprot:309168_1